MGKTIFILVLLQNPIKLYADRNGEFVIIEDNLQTFWKC